MTEWMLAVGEVAIQAAIRVAAQATSFNNISAKLAVQTAAVRPDSPSAWALVSSGLTVTGSSQSAYVGGSVKQTVTYGSNFMWVRWGVAVAMTGSASSGSADITLAISTFSKGMLVGTFRGQVLTAAASTEMVKAIGGWIPVMWADEVYAGIQVLSGGANVNTRLMYRTATSNQNDPSGWSATADTGTTTTERVAADAGIGTTLGSATQWVQFGIAYWTASGGGTQSADLIVSVAVRKG